MAKMPPAAFLVQVRILHSVASGGPVPAMWTAVANTPEAAIRIVKASVPQGVEVSDVTYPVSQATVEALGLLPGQIRMM
jgi:hypothetical protein